jgi:hypothetical protein
MKTNDPNRGEHSSKHAGGKTAVLPTADSPKSSPVTAPPPGGTVKPDQRDLAGKGKEMPAPKGQHADSAGKFSGERTMNPNVKR